MPKSVVIDELLVTVRVPADLPDPAADRVHRTLTGGRFLARLRAAVRGVVGEDPDLRRVRVTVTR